MSDEEVRRGARAMVSGGMASLDDDAVTQLGKTVNETQRERGLVNSVDEVLYLQEFVKISEERLSQGIDTGSFNTGAQPKLDALNEKFPNISESVRKLQVLCPDLGTRLYDDGWMSSSYQC